MNRTALCIRMLQLLNAHKKLSIADLAYYLETNPRNIIEFKKELEAAGYYIKTTTGKYGGYSFDEKMYLPRTKLLKEEIDSISTGLNYINARNDFVNKKEFNIAVAKLVDATASSSLKEFLVYNRFPLIMSMQEIEKRHNIISCSIERKRAIRIKYSSLTNKNKLHTVNPYKLFMFNNAWFMLAMDVEKKKVLYFKLNRIDELTQIKSTFRIPEYYKESDYFNEFGLKENGDWFNIELKISGKSIALIKERVYGKNQIIADDGANCLFQCCMQNKTDIVSFVLGLSTDCQVISPEWLKQELCEIAMQQISLYGGKGGRK